MKAGIRLLLMLMLAWQGRPLQAQYKVVAYHGAWSMYRDYHIYEIPVGHVTHVIYSFAQIVNGEIAHGDPWADVDRFYPGDSHHPDSLRGNLHQLLLLKAQFPQLKTLLSIGGWEADGFSDAALTDSSRLRFARSCAAYVVRYQFDGIDIDWEFPVSGGPPGFTERPEDRANFTFFMQALRGQLDSLAVVYGHPYLLTAALRASGQNVSYDIPAVTPIVDWFNIMTYDLHGFWEDFTHFNAPLFASNGDPYSEPWRTLQTGDSSLRGYLAQGVPPEKLLLGVAYYAKGYGNVADVNNGLFQPYSGVSTQGTWTPGHFDYWDLAANYVNRNGYTRYYRNEAESPWLYNPATQVFISYDDSQSVSARADYVRAHDLGGAMFWMMGEDSTGELTRVLWNRLNCEGPRDLTLARPAGGGMRINFTARQSAQYRVWWTEVRTHDGDPNGGSDPDWHLGATLPGSTGQLLSWVDSSALTPFRAYVVTEICP